MTRSTLQPAALGRRRAAPADAAAATHAVEVLLPGLLARQPREVGRAISWVEDGGALAREVVGAVYPRSGRAKLVGVTGPPGAGKSTLVDRLTRRLRERGDTVGILAVDPTSPFSGGAILGDRIRMQTLYTDPGVFIRSMATRGAMGGLAPATRDAVDVLDAAGFDWVLVETVGVGQDEVDVVRSVDTVVLVTLPGLGDEIQAIKAGIMEIADVFVINKSDRDGADKAARDVAAMLALDEEMAEGEWMPPIVKTVASLGTGIDDVLEAIAQHRRHLERSGELDTRRREHLRLRVESLLEQRILSAARRGQRLQGAVDHAHEAREDPYAVAERLFAGVVEEESRGGVRQ